MQVLIESGVNRLSIGVQSFDDRILGVIGRKHSAKTAISAYQNACEAGFPNINIDIMFGLPLQTPEKWETDLEILTDLSPGYASVYRLRQENPNLHKTYMKEPQLFPDRETVFLMNIMAVEELTDGGYQQSEAPSTFLLPSKSSYHSPYHGFCAEELGIGAGAWSYFSGVRYHNYHDLERYMMCVNKGSLPISFAGRYSKRQQIERETIRMLRTPEGVNKSDFNARFGIAIEKLFDEPLQKLTRSGFIMDDGRSYKLSYKGLLFTVEVFKQFYSHDPVTRLKDVIYSNKFLKHCFLKKRWSRSVEGITRVAKTVTGYMR
jgi:oxygen-independent coproporphyrinogen-3 oxidase